MLGPCSRDGVKARVVYADSGRLITSHKLSPLALTQAKLARIEALDPQINAFITVTGERALSQARVAEAAIARGNYRSPMHGTAFVLKDIYATAGILTSGHSKICIDNIPAEDAAVSASLEAAGGVLQNSNRASNRRSANGSRPHSQHA